MLNKFTSNAIFKFHGGIYPEENKLISNKHESIKLDLSHYFRVQVNQSSIQAVEDSIKIIVTKGQDVKRGEALTTYQTNSDNFSVPIHSPCDGRVTDIELFNCGHPSTLPEMTIVIQAEPVSKPDQKIKNKRVNWKEKPTEYLIHKIRNAGIVGLGGATFPSHIKQSSPLFSSESQPAKLIINAMECEPYITCDDRMLREHAKEVVDGALIIAKIVNCEKIIFAIEDNKPEAIQALQNSIKSIKEGLTLSMSILITATKYPSGGEKQLIQIVTGQELAKQQLPKDLNILVHNVATLFAIYHAIVFNKNLSERLVTITGDLVSQAGNYWIPFGTSISHIIRCLNISEKDLDFVTIGGPLMGQKIKDFSIPTSKKVNCLIFNKKSLPLEIKDCIRCGECETICPIKLLPQQLYWFSKTEQWQSMDRLNLNTCIECGACDYVCPSNIPLVDYFRFAKSETKHLALKEKTSEIAKQRFNNKEKRLIRIKEERKARQKKTALERQKASENKSKDPEGKKAAILAALNRVKSKTELQVEDTLRSSINGKLNDQ